MILPSNHHSNLLVGRDSPLRQLINRMIQKQIFKYVDFQDGSKVPFQCKDVFSQTLPATRGTPFLPFIDATSFRRKVWRPYSWSGISIIYNFLFLHYWGMGGEEIIFYQQLAELLSRHDSVTYSSTLGWLCYTFSFYLLQSATMCILVYKLLHLS